MITSSCVPMRRVVLSMAANAPSLSSERLSKCAFAEVRKAATIQGGDSGREWQRSYEEIHLPLTLFLGRVRCGEAYVYHRRRPLVTSARAPSCITLARALR